MQTPSQAAAAAVEPEEKRQQDNSSTGIGSDRQRYRTHSFPSYLQKINAYLEKRKLLTPPGNHRNYDVFISYAWKKSKLENEKLQEFLRHLHNDLQTAGLNVFFDNSDMHGDIFAAMEKGTAHSKIILSICTPLLKQAIKDQPNGNAAKEVNYALARAQEKPDILLPVLFEGTEWNEALPLQMQEKINPNPYQNICHIFSCFDHQQPSSEPFLALYNKWMVDHLIPRILENLGVQSRDLLLATIAQLFHSQTNIQQKSSEPAKPDKQLPNDNPDNSQEEHAETNLKAFEFSLRRLQELTKYHNADSKNEIDEHSVLFVSLPLEDPLVQRTYWIAMTQFIRHLKMVGFAVHHWTGSDRFPECAPHKVIILCTPHFKKIVETGLAQKGSRWSQLQQHLAQPNVECYPVIQQGTYTIAVPDWSKNYKDEWLKNFLAYNSHGKSLDASQEYYYQCMMGTQQGEGLLPVLLGYGDREVCYQVLHENLWLMQKGYGLQALLQKEDEVIVLQKMQMDQHVEEFVEHENLPEAPPTTTNVWSMATAAVAGGVVGASFTHSYQSILNGGRAAKYDSLGLRYKYGIGVTKDSAKAAHFFDLAAAKRGDVNAQYHLGMHYYNRQNFDKAVLWLESAAKKEHVEAQFTLGKYYYDRNNLDKAVPLLESAAKKGHVDAQFTLGQYYYDHKDLDKAVPLLESAEKKGHVGAQCTLGIHYLKLTNIDIGAHLSGSLDKPTELFFEFSIPKLDGIHDPVHSQGVGLLKRAAQKDNSSKIILALCYLALGEIENAIQSLELVVKSIKPSDSVTNHVIIGNSSRIYFETSHLIYLLGALYYKHGQIEKSISCFKSVATIKNPQVQVQAQAQAQYTLAILFYENGYPNVVAKNPEEAANLYESSAKQKHKEAQFSIGNCYEHGIGRKKNIKEAIRYYYFAAEQGELHAKTRLETLQKKSPELAAMLKAVEQEEKAKAEQADKLNPSTAAAIASLGLLSKPTSIENKKEDPSLQPASPSIRSNL
ncbi:MAG: hypothetical protein K0Q74_1271 [Gammaproteobacteria bacterium]|jgi:TPR repeat protein|nr:hypothetical protein [Gammaproteobacteria bacterium]